MRREVDKNRIEKKSRIFTTFTEKELLDTIP